MLTHRNGNLFDADDLDLLAHGCNCRGYMGAGIAYEFARRWPEMETIYRDMCDEGTFELGTVMPYWLEDERDRAILNLATQYNPGANARIYAIQSAFENVSHWLDEWVVARPKKIGIPKIGCGIGGLDWYDVEPAIIEAWGPTNQTEIVVFTL